jgi:hypothetical protein
MIRRPLSSVSDPAGDELGDAGAGFAADEHCDAGADASVSAVDQGAAVAVSAVEGRLSRDVGAEHGAVGGGKAVERCEDAGEDECVSAGEHATTGEEVGVVAVGDDVACGVVVDAAAADRPLQQGHNHPRASLASTAPCPTVGGRPDSW